MKQLTIAVPSYNSEKFLDKGLGSYVYEDGTMDPRLQIIVVNDGSTDGTLALANEWADRFPDNIIVVDKENGGHGSGINAGADRAEGRYYKVIDSDDWILTENLPAVLDALEETNADAVITGFHTVNMVSGVVLPYGTGQLPEPDEKKKAELGTEFANLRCFGKREAAFTELMEEIDNIPAIQSFHGIMYNTEFYRGTGIRMSEKVFFEDQEYAILPFAHVETVLLLPEFFYEYQIGSANQSVNFENQAKRSSHFLGVMEKMINYHKSCTGLNEAQDEFIIWRLCNAAVSYYATVLVKGSDKADGRAKALEFRSFLQEKEPEVAGRCEGKYKTMLKLNKIPGAASLYGKLFNSKFYASFKKHWIR